MGTSNRWRCQKCGKPAIAVRRVYVLASVLDKLPEEFTDDVAHADGTICVDAQTNDPEDP